MPAGSKLHVSELLFDESPVIHIFVPPLSDVNPPPDSSLYNVTTQNV